MGNSEKFINNAEQGSLRMHSEERFTENQVRESFWPVPWSGTVRHPNSPEDLGIGLANYLSYSINVLSVDYERKFDEVVNDGWVRAGVTGDSMLYRIDKLEEREKVRFKQRLSSLKHSGGGLSESDLDQLELAIKTDSLKELIRRSLYDSQIMRLERSDMRNLNQHIDMSDPEVEMAVEGLASPRDVLSMIRNNPELVSAELAKESHPLSYGDADDMNSYMANLIAEQSVSVADDQHEDYKKVLVDGDIPAAVIERKKIIGSLDVHGEPLLIGQRLRLLVRGDEDAIPQDEYLDRKIVNDKRQAELFDKVRQELPQARDGDESFRWLQPVSTSYYAYYPYRVAPKTTS